MMLANIGPWQIVVILLIVIVIFGTKRLRQAGSDIGHGLKGFREIVGDEDKDDIFDIDFEKKTLTVDAHFDRNNSGRIVYSCIKEKWYSDDTATKYPFPVVAHLDHGCEIDSSGQSVWMQELSGWRVHSRHTRRS